MAVFNEADVQKYLQQVDLEAFIDDAESTLDCASPTSISALDEYGEPKFELWKLLTEKAIEILRYNHRLALSG